MWGKKNKNQSIVGRQVQSARVGGEECFKPPESCKTRGRHSRSLSKSISVGVVRGGERCVPQR